MFVAVTKEQRTWNIKGDVATKNAKLQISGFAMFVGLRCMTNMCETCKRLMKVHGTAEYVNPWLCSCDRKRPKTTVQLRFRTARNRGTLTRRWQ